ncbi:MAG: extracellular solute-binding protein [Muribaculaceae bacterium]|nr:extracellular solute-binding protein [bacterium]MCM1494028.1 extracellular solute-binding protein [Muribaculaceae bacterium]
MKNLRRTEFQIRHKHNRTNYFVSCLMMCVSLFLTACSKGNVSNEYNLQNADNAVHMTQGKEWVYVPERIEIKDKCADYGGMQLVGDTVCYISINGETESNTQDICQYSLIDKELTSIPIDWKDDGSIREISCYTFDENGNTWLIVNVYSAGFSRFRRFLYKFDSEGKNLFFKDISEQLGSGTSVDGMAVDGQGRIYVFNPETGIWLYTNEGIYYGAISYGYSEEVQIKGAVDGNDGKFFVCISKEENTYCTLAEVDFESKQLTASLKDFPAVNGICKDPTGRYDFLLCDDIAACGYDLSTQKKEELFIWGDSDVNGYFVKHLSLLGDGRYFCTVDDWINGDRSVVLFTKTSSEEAPQRLNLVLATVNGGSELTALAVGYNRNNNQYHITLKEYGSLTDLYNAILAKETIDIIDLSGVNVKNLSNQGIFEDLNPYLESSETFTCADFLDGILDVYTFGDTLVGIPESFRLRTVVGDGNKIGNDAGLTLEGLLTIAEHNPGAMPFGEITKEEMMQYIMMFNEDAFIDWESGECHFDSAQFKEVLEFVNRFPDSIESGREDVSLPSKIQNGDVLFAIADMKGVKAFQLYEEIFGENAAFVGFPTMDGKGGTLLFADNAFGIVAGSENKKGAWDFIENVLKRKNTEGMDNEEIYHAYYYHEPSQFPTMKKALAAITDYIMEIDKANKFSTRHYSDGWSFTSHAVTWDEINAILELVPEATPFFSVNDDQIITIINEDARAYYSGQKGIVDVVSIIQNRVQLYVDENK